MGPHRKDNRERNWFVTLFTDVSKEKGYCIPTPHCLVEHSVHNKLQFVRRSPLEACPETGKHHYHYYVECSEKISMAALKFYFGNTTINCGLRMGTDIQAMDYCTSSFYSKKRKARKAEYTCVDPDEKHLDAGVKKEQGKRSDWAEVYKDCKDLKKPIRKVLDDNPALAVRFESRIRDARASCRRDHYNQPGVSIGTREVHVWTGPPGLGKDTEIKEKYGKQNVYELTKDERGAVWWDGYSGQDVLLISDFDSSQLSRERLLAITGNRMVRVGTKGATEYWTGTKVYFTSNVPLREWYANWGAGFSTEGQKEPVTKDMIAFGSRITTHQVFENESPEDALALVEEIRDLFYKPHVVKRPNYRMRLKRKQRSKLRKEGVSITPLLPGTPEPLLFTSVNAQETQDDSQIPEIPETQTSF